MGNKISDALFSHTDEEASWNNTKDYVNSNLQKFKHLLCIQLGISWGASLVAQLVRNPPAMQETPVQFLGGEVPLKKE